MSYPARGPALAGIDGRRMSPAPDSTPAVLITQPLGGRDMSYPTRATAQGGLGVQQ